MAFHIAAWLYSITVILVFIAIAIFSYFIFHSLVLSLTNGALAAMLTALLLAGFVSSTDRQSAWYYITYWASIALFVILYLFLGISYLHHKSPAPKKAAS